VPVLGSLEVTPNGITIQPETGYAIELIARDAEGDRFDISLYEAYEVAWSGSVERAEGSESGSGDFVGFFPPDDTPSTVVVSLAEPVTFQTPVVVTATVSWDDGSMSADAILTLAGPPDETPPDRITSNLTEPVAAFLNGCALEALTGTRPDVFWDLYEFSGTLELADNLTEQACGRTTNADFSVFSKAQQPVVFSSGPATSKTTDQMIWTDVIGDHLVADDYGWATVDLIDGTVRDFTAGSGWLSDSQEANSIFKENRAGIQFNAVKGDAPPGLCDGTLKADCSPDYLKDCLGIPVDEARLNVIYLETLGGPLGLTCRPDQYPSVKARVVFVSEDEKYDETLAHEFGHVLGHRWPFLCWLLGHVKQGVQEGFENTNLMHDRTYATPKRDRLTVGQVFRMIVDDGSWYQVEPTFDNTILGRVQGWGCPSKPYDGGICPQIHRDPGPKNDRIDPSTIDLCTSGVI